MEQELRSSWDAVLGIILHSDEILKDTPEGTAWLKNVLESNVKDSDLSVGTTFLAYYRNLLSSMGKSRTIELDFESLVIGWALEILHEALLIAVDIIENRPTRNGKTCWHQNPNVGMIAVNDIFLLESIVDGLLRETFEKKEYYTHLLEVLNKNIFHQIIGQCRSSRGQKESKKLSNSNFLKTQTSYFTHYLPIAMSMVMAGIQDEKAYKSVECLMIQFGNYCQKQNEILEYLENVGINSNIGLGNPTWLIEKALKICTLQQRQELLAAYGKNTLEQINRVKRIYKSLDLLKLYEKVEESTYKAVIDKLDELPNDIVSKDFLSKKIGRISL